MENASGDRVKCSDCNGIGMPGTARIVRVRFAVRELRYHQIKIRKIGRGCFFSHTLTGIKESK